MRLPYLNRANRARLKVTGTFGGWNANLVVQDNEFADMMNMSDRFYPAIGTREPRGEQLYTVPNYHGLIHKNGLFWVSGGTAYYNNTQVGTLEDSDKQLVGMGAYIVVWPDKKVYNTADGTWTNVEKTYSASQVTLAPFSKDSAFTCIYASGIADAFEQYDAVTITGFTGDYADLNATKVIQDKGTDISRGQYIVVTYAATMPVDTDATAADAVEAAEIGRTPRTIYQDSVTITMTLGLSRTAPDMDFICESGNRIWGCSSDTHEIYASKLGDPTNWNSFEGIATDSYASTVGTDGNFTGCIGHLGNVLFFKERTIHRLIGTKPANFQLTSAGVAGVRAGCERSLQIINETLYYVGRDGIYSYDGSVPYSISNNFGEVRLQDAVSCQYKSRLYLSASDGDQYRLYVFDPQTQIWMIEDGARFMYAAYGDGNLYYITPGGTLTTIAADGEFEQEWHLESGDIREMSISNKYISKLLFNVWLSRGSVMNVYIKWDDGPLWEHKGQISSEFNRTYTLPIIPKRCNKFRYRLEGKGTFKLLALGRYIEDGSEVLHGFPKH